MSLQRLLHGLLHHAVDVHHGAVHPGCHPGGVYLGRAITRDIAFPYRMGAGFPGTVNRTHPAWIEPVLIDTASPPTAYGQAIVIDPASQGVRPLAAADSALTAIYGITVRPFPMQQASATNYGAAAFGAAAPPSNGALDVLRSGYIMTALGGATPASKGGLVYVWVAASSGPHVQSGFEAAPTAGSTIALDGNTTFNGAADAASVVEIAFNV